jgi:hypothetical protein
MHDNTRQAAQRIIAEIRGRRNPGSFDDTENAGYRDRSPGTAPSLAFDENQQVGIDGIGIGGRHAVRKAHIGFQGAVLQ